MAMNDEPVEIWGPVIQPERPDALLSDERLAEIEARAEAAPPPPWKHTRYWRQSSDPFHVVVLPKHDTIKIETIYGVDQDGQTAEFLAHARQDIPDLLAEVCRLRRTLSLSEASRGVPSVVGQD